MPPQFFPKVNDEPGHAPQRVEVTSALLNRLLAAVKINGQRELIHPSIDDHLDAIARVYDINP